VESDPNNQLIPLTVIPLRGAHCRYLFHLIFFLFVLPTLNKDFLFYKSSFSSKNENKNVSTKWHLKSKSFGLHNDNLKDSFSTREKSY